MTQQEINTYFRDNGYTEDPENTFVDPSGQFTFTTDEEQLSMEYPGPPEYSAVIRNEFLSDDAQLASWITLQEQEAINPPEL